MFAAHDRVEVTSFAIERESFVETERRLSDTIWQASRDTADWVVVVDIDDHLYHPDLRQYLQRCTDRHVTAIEAIGYEMVSDSFPEEHARLCERVRRGLPSHY